MKRAQREDDTVMMKASLKRQGGHNKPTAQMEESSSERFRLTVKALKGHGAETGWPAGARPRIPEQPPTMQRTQTEVADPPAPKGPARAHHEAS